jgi:hypothetical protein
VRGIGVEFWRVARVWVLVAAGDALPARLNAGFVGLRGKEEERVGKERHRTGVGAKENGGQSVGPWSWVSPDVLFYPFYTTYSSVSSGESSSLFRR